MSKSTKSIKTPSTNGTAAKEKATVNKPQMRILAALAKSKGPLNTQSLAEKSKVAGTWITCYTFKACALNKTPSLVEAGLVKAISLKNSDDKINERVYQITATGKRVLEQAEKASKG